MNLHALKLFYEAASRGGVTRAAEALHISQPAVTAQIRNLEQELGLPLFASSGRGMRLTEAGELLFGYAGRLFALEREMTWRMHDYRDGVRGRLAIAATFLPANHLLPGWLAAFKQRHEQTEPVLATVGSAAAYEKLLHYEADLAFIGGSKDAPAGIVREELMEDELWFVVPAGHRLAGRYIGLAEMMREPFILREEGSSAREKLFALCRLRNMEPPRVGLQFNGLNETIRAVMAGYGAIFLSSLEVGDYVRQGAVARVHVEDVQLTNPIAACMRADEDMAPVARQFLSFVKENL